MQTIFVKAALAAAGVSALAVMAQAAAPGGTGGTGSTAQGAATDTELSEVTVTGSRVIMNGNDAPTPVTVVNVEEMLVTKPSTIAENLAELPVFTGSRGVTNQPSDSGPAAGSAVASLNLRNLGGLRALTLYDGHRVPPTTADGYVDVNMLPQMLIQRVDVVTGGASAVYGSDAITGVVNFITDTKFKGTKFTLQRGVSTYNDDQSYEVGVAFGRDLFGGRGHIEGSYQRHNDSGILHRLSTGRTWLSPFWTLQGDGSAALPYHLQDNVRITIATFGGLIVCPTTSATPGNPATCLLNGQNRPLVGYTFDENGILSPFQGGPTGPAAGLANGTIQIGGDGAYFDAPSLKSASKLDQFFLRFDYDVSDRTHAYFAASGAVNYLDGYPNGLRSFGQGWFIGSCNAFLSQQYQQQLGCTNPATQANSATPPTFRLSKFFQAMNQVGIPTTHTDSYAHNNYLVGGLEGRLGNGYRWDLALTHSQARLNTRSHKLHHQGQLFAALDAVINPANGQVVCNVTLTNPGLYPDCVPFNPFGPTSASLESINYIFGRIEHTDTNKLDSLSGSIAGAPFSSWAGPVDVALSGEFRRQSYELISTSLPTDIISCTGLRFGNCVNGSTTNWLNSWAPRTPVQQTAAEAAVEFNLPLLKDKTFFRQLNLNAAARYTRYKNDPNDPLLAARSINATTWKAGVTWEMTDWLTLRAARSRDIRAPNLYDLYTPVSVTPNSLTVDYLQPGTPLISPASQGGGNPDLQPEVAHTTTVGFVFRPASSFNMAVDGYNINISNALAGLNGGAQAVQLACYASGGTSPLCQLQERPLGCCSNTTSANGLTKIYNRRINVAVQKTWGIDFETNYNTRLRNHAFAVRTLVTYQPHLVYQQATLATVDQAGVAYNDTYGLSPTPIWKATLFAHYNVTDSIAIDLSERYRSRMRWTSDPAKFGIGGIGSVAYTNLNLTYIVRSDVRQFNVFMNVQNLFDKNPPPAGNPAQAFQPGLTSNTIAIGDDFVGRYYSLGVRVRL